MKVFRRAGIEIVHNNMIKVGDVMCDEVRYSRKEVE
jgi:hypothetical protein